MLCIRNARLDELPTIKAIDQQLFGKESYPLFVLRQFYDTAPDYLLTAEYSGQVAGYMLAHYDSSRAVGWLLSLGVLPEQRGKRIGEKLMAACMARLEAQGATTLYLTVHPSNAAGIHIYSRLGFAVAEAFPDYYFDGTPRLLMHKLLQQER
jgi:[ribosomal protein S18]-alanine N-acetyltransferase